MKKAIFLAFICLATFSAASMVWAQPTIPKESIPPNLPAEVKAQIERLYSTDAVDRGSAAFRLAKMGDKAVPSIPFLVANLHDSKPIIDCGDPSCQLPEHQISPADEAEKTLIGLGKPAVEALQGALGHKEADVRKRIVTMLGKIKDSGSVPTLLSLMKDQNRNVRMTASWALAEIGEPSVGGLIDILKDGQRPFETRADAAWALGIIRNPKAVEPLIGAFQQKDADLTKQASRALGRITGKDLGQDPKAWQEWWVKEGKGKS